MAVTKINGFSAPYRSLTLRNESNALVSRNGVLNIDGPVTESGGDVTIPPLTFIQEGMVVKKDVATIVTIPGGLLAPFFVTVTALTPADTDDLAFQFAKTPLDVSSNETIIAEFDGVEWRTLPLVSTESVIRRVDEANVDFDRVGPLGGLLTIINGGDYETAPGAIVDKSGFRAEVEGTFIKTIVPADPTWDRVDRIVYRRELDDPKRIGRRQFICGGTHNDASQTAFDTQLEGATVQHNNVQTLVHTDNVAYFIVSEGFGIDFDIIFNSYAADRTSQVANSVTLVSGASEGKFSFAIDVSGNIHLVYSEGTDLKYERFDSTGSSLGAAVVVDAQTAKNPSVHIDPAGTKVFIVYQGLLGPTNNQIFFTTRDITTGNLITAPVRLMTNASNIISPSIYVDKDLLAYIAWEDATAGGVAFEVRDDIGVAVDTPIIVSDATAHSSGTLSGSAHDPTMYVTDNKSVHVAFLQNKAGTDGLAIWRDGESRMLDFDNPGEDILAYGATFDDFMNGTHLILCESGQVNYYKVEDDGDADINTLTVVISASGGAFASVARDPRGSLVHTWTEAFPGTFSNVGGAIAVSDIGPDTVIGSTATINLSNNEFIVPAASLASIGGRVVIAGSGAGNNGTHDITNIVIQDLNGANDVAVVTTGTIFSAESPAGGVTSQFQEPDGAEARFIKTISETDALAFRLAELDTDNLLARLIFPGPVVLNYIPGGVAGVDSDIFAIFGGATVSWEQPTPDELVISGSLKILDLVNNFVYVPPDVTSIILEDQALYIELDGVDFAPVFKVADIASLPWADPIQVLGFRKDGSFHPHLLAVGDVGELSSGEVTIIGSDLSNSSKARLGLIGDTLFVAYTSTGIISAPDSYPIAISKLDVAALAARQDRNLKLIDGGTYLWTLASTELTFSVAAHIQIPGLTDARNTIPTSENPIILDVDGKIAYVSVNRDTGALSNRAVTVVDVAAFVPDNDRVVIARRVGDEVLVGQTFLLKDGERLEMDGALAEINRYFSQLNMKPHESAVENVRISGVDTTLLDSRILSQELENSIMNFLGAVVEFDTGDIFKSDGTTPLGVNFTPFTIPVGEYFWYSVTVVADAVGADNRIGAQILISPATGSDAVKADAPFPNFPSGKKVGAVLIQNIAGTMTVDTVRQLGVGSGSGGGGANSLDSQYDDILRESTFELQDTNIFELDGGDKIDSATAGVGTSGAEFTAPGQNIISTDVLDLNEFLGNGRDVSIVQLIADYFIDSVDTGPAVFEFSRDSKAHWQEGGTPKRIGSTGRFEINHVFKREKDSSLEDEYLDSNADTDLELEDVGALKFSQEIVLAAVTEVKEVSLYLSKLGAALGNFQILLFTDDGSGDPGDAVATSGDVLVSSVPGASTKQTLDIGDLAGLSLEAGTYHIVVQTDDAYKASFTTGVDALRVSADSSAPTPPVAQEFDGAVWADIATTALTYEVIRFDDAFQTLDEHNVSNADGEEVLNATTQIKLGQPFTVAPGDDYVIQRLTAYMDKLGAATGGNVFLQIVRDDGLGDPSTNSADIMVETPAIPIAPLATGPITVTEVVSDAVIPDGTFHLVARTDAEYATDPTVGFDSGVRELRWRRDASAPTPPVGNSFDGTVWADIATTAFVYLIEGRPLELAVRITASTTSKLEGYALNYDVLAGTFLDNIPGRSVHFVLGDDDETDFQLSFLPAASTLLGFDVFSGQVYRRGAFEIFGQTVRFAPGTFADAGELYMIEFISLEGGQFDNSDINRQALEGQFLANLNKALDFSVPGRWISGRADNGRIVEMQIIEDVPGNPSTYKLRLKEKN